MEEIMEEIMQEIAEDKRKIMTKAELDEMLENRSKKNSDDTIKIENCRIMNMDLSDYELHNLILRNVVFRNVEFFQTFISNWNAENVVFDKCVVNKTGIKNSFFTECVFVHNNFSDNSLRNDNFFLCYVTNLNAPNTIFDRVSITNSSIISGNFLMADFYDCSIKKTDFNCCCFFKAGFNNADVEKISTLSNAGLSLACPETGPFIGYKKIFIDQSGVSGKTSPSQAIVKLLIPGDARRSSATSTKCRCDIARVLEILDLDGNKLPVNSGYSSYDCRFEYEVGKTVSVCAFNKDRWKECTTGIHFFTSFQDAVEFKFKRRKK